MLARNSFHHSGMSSVFCLLFDPVGLIFSPLLPQSKSDHGRHLADTSALISFTLVYHWILDDSCILQMQVHIFLGLQIVVFELPRAIQRLQEQTICELRATDAILRFFSHFGVEFPTKHYMFMCFGMGAVRYPVCRASALQSIPLVCNAKSPTILCPRWARRAKPSIPAPQNQPTRRWFVHSYLIFSTLCVTCFAFFAQKRVGPSTLESSGSGAYTGSVNDPTVAARLVADEFFDDPEELEVRGPVAGATAAPRLFGPGSE
jgi:hypothetical protein